MTDEKLEFKQPIDKQLLKAVLEKFEKGENACHDVFFIAELYKKYGIYLIISIAMEGLAEIEDIENKIERLQNALRAKTNRYMRVTQQQALDSVTKSQ